jgi:hypothetical protein
MIFHITYEFSPVQRNDAQKRFKETGAPPPSGVTMIGRWHCVQGHKGFTIAECSDPEAIAKWIQDWADLISFEVTPVLNDEQFTRVIS